MLSVLTWNSDWTRVRHFLPSFAWLLVTPACFKTLQEAASPAADDDGRQPPIPQFPVFHYVLSHQVGDGKR